MSPTEADIKLMDASLNQDVEAACMKALTATEQQPVVDWLVLAGRKLVLEERLYGKTAPAAGKAVVLVVQQAVNRGLFKDGAEAGTQLTKGVNMSKAWLAGTP